MKSIREIQFLILDLTGEIIFSDDNLFEKEQLPTPYVFDWSPFVESIFPILVQEEGKMYTFEKVKTIHPFLSGTYDYSFYKTSDTKKQSQIIWVISDCSEYYGKLHHQQQILNQNALRKQIVAFERKMIPELNGL